MVESHEEYASREGLECPGCGEILEDPDVVYEAPHEEGISGYSTCPSCGGVTYFDYAPAEDDSIFTLENIRFREAESDTDGSDTESTCPKCETRLEGERDGTPIFDERERRLSSYCSNCHTRLIPMISDRSFKEAVQQMGTEAEDQGVYTPSLNLVFQTLYYSGPMPRRELRRTLGRHRTVLGRALRRLDQIGAVETKPLPEDGRQTVYAVSSDFYHGE